MYEDMGGGQALALFWVMMIVSYAINAVALYFMAKKANVKYPWVAFVPVVQVVAMLHMIDKSGWHFFLLFIPIVNIILSVMWMVKLFQNFGMSKGLVVLNAICFFFVPIVPLVFFLVVAFSGSYTYQGTTRFTA
jgi:hypothetical protein